MRIAIVLSAVCVAVELGIGLWIDGTRELTQPVLFWSFLLAGVSGALLGYRIGMGKGGSLPRWVGAGLLVLVAWRLAAFPLMVICGWVASLGEWLTWQVAGVSVVYPTFLVMLLAANLAIAAVATVAVGDPPYRRWLWLAGGPALAVAFLVSFSWPSDFVLLADGPWAETATLPPISEPVSNPYAEILREHRLGVASTVLAVNAALTYPLVPESPWARAMKGTLEALARKTPRAGSKQRIDEHYLAYLAAHRRLHVGRLVRDDPDNAAP